MSRNLLSLAKSLEKRATKIGEVGHEKKVEAASEMLKMLVEITPVDESTALSNWQVGVGRPVNSEVPPYVKGSKGSTAGASRSAAIAEGLERIKNSQPGQPIYLSNLVPYIRRLNQGWSKQAPAGFVDRALMLGREIVRTARFVRLRK